jgi:5-methylcytosine-specific restriction endonuclease McrA
VLGGPADAGRASYQIALSVCAQCGSAEQQAGGGLVAVGADVIEQARCDGQHLGYIASSAAEGHSHDEKARPRATVNGARATQTIPPALRRSVFRRDHERCQVPGCTHATFLDLHHIEPRSDGGQHELENLITICGAHHRAAHRGKLLITGSSTQPHFRHADGSEYGHAARAHTIAAQTQVFFALRHLGFRERDIHAALGELRKQNDLREASSEELLREALQRLAPPRVKPIRCPG